MGKISPFLRSAIVLLAVSGCAPQAPSYTPVAGVDDLMEGLVAPAAEVVWEAVWTEISETGIKEVRPQDEEGWHEVGHNAMAIAEAGNIMQFDPNHKDDPEWVKLSQLLTKTALDVKKSADAKDPDEILQTGGVMYEACRDCHAMYVPDTPPTATAP
jgi:hypothetical protein